MGVFEVREDNMPEPGGKDDLKIGHKIVEEMEEYLKDVKQYITDPNYKNCKDLGSYILEKQIPKLLNEALEYIGHSDTYKRDHDNELIHQRTWFSSELNHPDPDCSLDKFITDHDNISYKLIDENKGNKTVVYTNLNNSKESSTNQFMDENLKIDVPALILNYLDHDDEKSLNILKEYSKTDFLIGMSPECECYWYIEYHINNILSDLNDIISDAECCKIGMYKLKKQFDEDTLWWFEEIARTGRLYSTDTFDYEKSRAIKAYNYYSTHPEIGKIFLSRDAVLKFKREISENRGCFSKFSDLNLYKYRNKLIKEFEELEKDKERDARREREFLKNYGKH